MFANDIIEQGQAHSRVAVCVTINPLVKLPCDRPHDRITAILWIAWLTSAALNRDINNLQSLAYCGLQ